MTLRLLTISEAAEELGRARSWVEDRIKDGTLPSVTHGHRRYVAERDLQLLLPGATQPRDPDEARVVVMPRVWV